MFRKEVLKKNANYEFGDVIVLPKSSIYLSCLFLFFVVCSALIFISLNTYEKKERVTGYVLPDKGVLKVFVPRDGFIKTLSVQAGQRVNKGDILALVQSQIGDTDGQLQSDVMLSEFLNQLGYLKRELSNKMETITIEERRLKLFSKTLASEISILENQLKIELQKLNLAREDFLTIEDIGDKDYFTKADINRSQQAKLAIDAGVEQIKLLLVQKNSDLDQNRLELTQLKTISKENMLNYDRQHSLLSQQISQTKNNGLYTIKSPVNGTVSSLQVLAGNGIKAGMPLVSILPTNSSLIVKLAVSSRSIGFIQVGQEVRIRYDAFPYQRYGSYTGIVESITQNALTDSELAQTLGTSSSSSADNGMTYVVNVSLPSSGIAIKKRKISLQPGMSLSATIITEKQSLLEWLLDPLYTVTRRSS
ncbi:HlyD family efflux transporter periplasmic adaptor subunit [Flavobacterium sp. W21_SRS_FM6]|uniref:HlyD family efflux transporter periplasmic adaptor subunit n=1 Tax=Flavobacterium sp. W21_SRS_FM6 TaxID=3240268 RepID=UPI003F9101BF